MKRKRKHRFRKAHSGFTLIELLTVISIIGLLASVILVNVGDARKKARDARRLADIRQTITALNLYYDQYGDYPGPVSSYGEEENGVSGSVNCGGWDSSSADNDGDGKPFIEPLADSGIMAKPPHDPLEIPIVSGWCGGYKFMYYRYSAGDNFCDGARGNYYVLGIPHMESKNGVRPFPNSPGFKCSSGMGSRDWQSEFDWVTGQYSK